MLNLATKILMRNVLMNICVVIILAHVRREAHMTARRPSSPPLSSSPRASIDPSSYPSIDSVLKELKSCSRRLQTTFSAYHDELQILERLFYKGKNQHRSALFWKRAAEMKRYGERLDALGFPDIFALLRSSF